MQIVTLLSPDKHTHTQGLSFQMFRDPPNVHPWIKGQTHQVKNFRSTNLTGSWSPSSLPSLFSTSRSTHPSSFLQGGLTEPARSEIPAEVHFNGDITEGCTCFTEEKRTCQVVPSKRWWERLQVWWGFGHYPQPGIPAGVLGHLSQNHPGLVRSSGPHRRPTEPEREGGGGASLKPHTKSCSQFRAHCS